MAREPPLALRVLNLARIARARLDMTRNISSTLSAKRRWRRASFRLRAAEECCSFDVRASHDAGWDAGVHLRRWWKFPVLPRASGVARAFTRRFSTAVAAFFLLAASSQAATPWLRSTPEEQGIDCELLARMLMRVQREQIAVHSFILVRNDHLVAEEYFYPYTADTPHVLYSVSKSFTSALLGIAIEQGLFSGVDERVVDIFPASLPAAPSAHLRAMTLRHLLTMSTGHAQDTTARITATTDWVRAFLALPVENEPGAPFVYNSGATVMLSAAIQNRSGMNALAYARQFLFPPLEITDYGWTSGPNNVTAGGWGLNLRPLDMAKFGLLYLHNGEWNGRRVVPAWWIAESGRRQVDNGPSGTFWESGYGYQFWLNDFGGYRADGAFAQYIFILPQYNAVAVFTSNLSSSWIPGDLMRDFVVPAMRGIEPRPVCLRANALLVRLADVARLSPSAGAAPPVFTDLPSARTAAAGESVTLAASAYGRPAPAWQWLKDGIPISGAAGNTLALANVAAADAADYSAVITNANGQLASFPIALNVQSAPTIFTQPVSTVVAAGEDAVFQVSAGGGELAYAWRRDGQVISDAHDSVLRIAQAGAADAGEYRVSVSNARGTIASETATLTVAAADDAARLANISVRASGGVDDQTLIVGFAIEGDDRSAGLPVLLRGVGPSLEDFSLQTFMSDPAVELHHAGRVIASNGDWKGNTLIAEANTRTGAFALPGNSADAALHAVLAPGTYTMHVISSFPDRGGIALAECYDTANSAALRGPRLVNISARAQVTPGDGTLIAGFVVVGSGTQRVLVRGIGPTLAAFHVAGVLGDPVLTLHAGDNVIAENDNWSGDAVLDAAFTRASAFALPRDSADAALLIALPAGVYTAHVSGKDGASGVALVEVYALAD